MNEKLVKALFIVAALYDGILAIAFILFASEIFVYFAVEPPNHMAYAQFPALLLLIFAAMFYRISTNPAKYRELILYGIGLKISYCVLAFGYKITTGIPSMWMPWAWADVVFLVLFIIDWKSLNGQARPA